MFALIRFEYAFTNAAIVAVGSESSMLTLHDGTPVGGGIFYSVRPVDHEMTVNAAAQMAERLSRKQAAALTGLVDAAPAGRRVEPGSRSPRRRTPVKGFADSTDLIAPAKRLQANGYVFIGGLDYAPKTYTVTPIGRIVANAVKVPA